MFDKLEDLRIRLDEILNELQEPDVANDQNRFRKLMKEQNDLTPIVEAYNEYKECKQAIEDSLEMLEEESDEEMRELAKEELNDNKKRVEELENELDGYINEIQDLIVDDKPPEILNSSKCKKCAYYEYCYI